MYCPKCAAENPDEGRFCRSCGIRLPAVVKDGEDPFVLEEWVNDAIAPHFKGPHKKSKDKKHGGWEIAMGSLFAGIAFAAISVILAFNPIGFGWWFWLLIPAFAMLGNGIAQTIRILTSKEKKPAEKKGSWEGAVGTLFCGLAFVAISVVLAFQPMGFGWWFWLLIPGFSIIGSGVAQVLNLSGKRPLAPQFDPVSGQIPVEDRQPAELPPNRTVPAKEAFAERFEHTEPAPPSVTEGTTRHLKIDPEFDTREFGEDEES